MIDENETEKISKFLSLVLRHKPESIGIVLDDNGWADVSTLIDKVNQTDISLNIEKLRYVVETNKKKRFAFNETLERIRASQGHSIKIDHGYTSQKPPEILYHGSGLKAVDSILKSGIHSGDRLHVHLSADIETAIKVGQRHGKPVVFKIMAEEMYGNGFDFFLSENDVWLTGMVPIEFLRR